MSDQSVRSDWIRRVSDVLIAGLGLLVLSPLMLLIAVAVILETGLPVFFAQTRVGRDGKGFRIYKFRKFHARNDVAGPLLTVRNDPRMSRVGRFLERTKLDELPQFYNVLKGDMAIVGPRPDVFAHLDCYTGDYRAMLNYKPGIFGPAQVAFRDAGALYSPHTDPTEFYREKIFPIKADLDLRYYPRRTLLNDVIWIIRGVLAVIGIHPTVRRIPVAPAHITDELASSVGTKAAIQGGQGS